MGPAPVVAALLALASAVFAVPAYEKPRGHVSDFAHVLDAPAAEALEQQATALQAATGVEVAVVTVPGLEGEPVEDFANALFRKWGVGAKETNEGFMILLAIADRKMRVEVGYGLEPVLTDGYVGSVQRSVRPELRDGRYGEAIRKALDAFGQKIGQAKSTSEPPPPGNWFEETWQDPRFPGWAFFTFGFFLTVGFLIPIFREVRSIFRSAGAARRSGSTSSSGGIGWASGGGFGGSSSFDSSSSSSSSSFGGFSGGDSGGGGASSDW